MIQNLIVNSTKPPQSPRPAFDTTVNQHNNGFKADMMFESQASLHLADLFPYYYLMAPNNSFH